METQFWRVSVKIGFRMNKIFQRREAGWKAVCYGKKSGQNFKVSQEELFFTHKRAAGLAETTTVDVSKTGYDEKDAFTGLRSW